MPRFVHLSGSGGRLRARSLLSLRLGHRNQEVNIQRLQHMLIRTRAVRVPHMDGSAGDRIPYAVRDDTVHREITTTDDIARTCSGDRRHRSGWVRAR